MVEFAQMLPSFDRNSVHKPLYKCMLLCMLACVYRVLYPLLGTEDVSGNVMIDCPYHA